MGDFESQEVEDLALKYLGTIPPSKRPQPLAMMPLPDRTAEPEKRFIEVGTEGGTAAGGHGDWLGREREGPGRR